MGFLNLSKLAGIYPQALITLRIKISITVKFDKKSNKRTRTILQI